MIIVSDTTPLRYLIEIGEADILASLFGRIIIPKRVNAELQDPVTPQVVREWMQSLPAWLIVQPADPALFTPQAKIDDGEREAIALALEIEADLLLCDDGKAIKEAIRLHLPVIRLFNILDKAAANALLDLPATIAKIRHTTFHLPPGKIIDALLERDQQRRLNQAS